MRSERNQNPPTGSQAKLLFSLYGKKLPQKPQDRLGSTVKVSLSINHKAMGIVEQIRVCMKCV